jgi:hypothetical protein
MTSHAFILRIMVSPEGAPIVICSEYKLFVMYPKIRVSGLALLVNSRIGRGTRRTSIFF